MIYTGHQKMSQQRILDIAIGYWNVQKLFIFYCLLLFLQI